MNDREFNQANESFEKKNPSIQVMVDSGICFECGGCLTYEFSDGEARWVCGQCGNTFTSDPITTWR